MTPGSRLRSAPRSLRVGLAVLLAIIAGWGTAGEIGVWLSIGACALVAAAATLALAPWTRAGVAVRKYTQAGPAAVGESPETGSGPEDAQSRTVPPGGWLVDLIAAAFTGSMIAGLTHVAVVALGPLVPWYVLGMTCTWLLQPLTFSERWLTRLRTTSVALLGALLLAGLLVLTAADSSVGQAWRVALFQFDLVAAFTLGTTFFFICLGTATAASLFRLVWPEQTVRLYAAYAAVWLVITILVGGAWPGINSTMLIAPDGHVTRRPDLPQVLAASPGNLQFVHTISDRERWIAGRMQLWLHEDEWRWVTVTTPGDTFILEPLTPLQDAGRGTWFINSSPPLVAYHAAGVDSLAFYAPPLPGGGADTVGLSDGRLWIVSNREIASAALDTLSRLWLVVQSRGEIPGDTVKWLSCTNITVREQDGSWNDHTSMLPIESCGEGNRYYRPSQVSGLTIDRNNSIWLTTREGVYSGDRLAGLQLMEGSPSSADDMTIRAHNGDTVVVTWQAFSAYRSVVYDGQQWLDVINSPSGYRIPGPQKGLRHTWFVSRWGAWIEWTALDGTRRTVDNWRVFGDQRGRWLTAHVDAGNDDLWLLSDFYVDITQLGWVRFGIGALLVLIVFPPAVIGALPRTYSRQTLLATIDREMRDRPEQLLVELRSIDRANDTLISMWTAVLSQKGAEDVVPWRRAAEAYLQVSTARDPAGVLSDFIEEAEGYLPLFLGGKELLGLYSWFEDSLSTDDTRAIVAMADPTAACVRAGDSKHEVGGTTFVPIPAFVVTWLTDQVLEVCKRLRDYEAAGTVESKLASLAGAVGQLSPLKIPDEYRDKLLPEIALSTSLMDRWRTVINNELDRVRGPVSLRISPASRTVPFGEEVTISVLLENIGHVPADDTRVILDSRGDYTFLENADGDSIVVELGRLMPGASLQADFRVRPASEDHIRVFYNVTYFDSLRGQQGSGEYADAISLLTTEPDFREIPNPYIPGTPVEARELFFGRADAIQFAQANLTGTKQNNVLVFHGQRRMGKTSILKQLPQLMDPSAYVFAFLDMQAYADVSTGSFLFDMADEIAFSLTNAGLEPPLLDQAEFENHASGSFNRYIRSVMRALDGKDLVLVFDEFETLERKVRHGNVSAEVYELLRHHMQHSAHLAFIFAGTERLYELSKDYWSTLFNIALFHEVGFLNSEAATDLITKPVAAHMRVDDPAVDKIVGLTSGHPYFIQIICRHLVNRMNEVRRSIATVSDVDEVLQATIEGAQAPISYLYEDQASREEQVVLSAMAEAIQPSGEPVGVPQIQEVLHRFGFGVDEEDLLGRLGRLVDRKILSETYLRGRFFRFTVDLVRLWIRRNQQIEKLSRA